MAHLSKILRSVQGGIAFRCPGCKRSHIAYTEKIPGRALWSWNGNVEAPTIYPSLNITTIRDDLTDEEWGIYDREFQGPLGPERALNDPRFRHVCHSIVADGKITFCSDSSHSLSGQTVALPPFNEEDL